ncbi:MAG: ribonuclease R [Gammaproteobacteria bacterium]|nr:ribonuclease R [Gammaproteobacteria bacterium]
MTKFNIENDPHAEREAGKYADPIPSRELILEFIAKCHDPVTHDYLAKVMLLETDDKREALRRRLRAMDRDGQLTCNRRGEYQILQELDLVSGKVIIDKEGRGVVMVDKDPSYAVMLSQRQMRSVFPGDKVMIKVVGKDESGQVEAIIVDVIERNTTKIIGRFHKENNSSYVVPEGNESSKIRKNIMILPADEQGAKHNQLVSVDIHTQPSYHNQAAGRVSKILSDSINVDLAIDSAATSYDLPRAWPAEVLAEIANLTGEVSEKDKLNRANLTDLPLVTIDGEDAKDFDDAVYCRPLENGQWELYVAIADVSYYVRPGTALDKEAQKRGTSVYFPGRVIPMLPEIISNELCSLKPNVDRLCMVSQMLISAEGELIQSRYYPAVMRSQARLTYKMVAEVLRQVPEGWPHAKVMPHLINLEALFLVLMERRKQRGALEFETIETLISLNEQGQVKEIRPTIRNDAHKIIEECMLMANVATAEFFIKSKVDALYRVHEAPKAEKIEDLRGFLSLRGLAMTGSVKPEPRDLNSVLMRAKGRDDYPIIQTVMLRSMNQAIYSEANVGHFGLAYEAYTHFTSPIRRYPDLIVHRVVRSVLDKKDPSAVRYEKSRLVEAGEYLSFTERRADEASREVVSALKCAYIVDKIGQEFDGIISGVTHFGFFVTLKEVLVDGLVHVSNLQGDYYQFDVGSHQLIGERTNQTFQLGQSVKVLLAKVDLVERKIDLELLGQPKVDKAQSSKAKFDRKKEKHKEKIKEKRKKTKAKKKLNKS